MLGIALHGLHEVGDEVVPPLELHVYLRPCVVNAHALLYERVVDQYENEYDCAHDECDDEQHVHNHTSTILAN